MLSRRRSSERSDSNVVDGVLRQRSKVTKVAGEDSRSTDIVGEGNHDGADRRRGTGTADGSPQRRRLASEDLVGGADVAAPQETILLEVTTVIAREGFGEHDSRNQRRPLAPSSQLLEARPVLDEHGDPAGVEDERHAERRRRPGPNNWSAHFFASARSDSEVGPSSPSNSAR